MHPPKAIMLLLGRLFNAFLWDGESRKIHWTSWEKLCFPKEEGGLDFHSLGDMVKAFSCKLWWNFRLQVSPWAKFMLCKYAQQSHPSMVELGHSSADSPYFLVAKFFIGDNWNEAKLRLWLPEPIVLQVLQVQFDPSKKDSMVWSPSANGLFSVSTAWETIRKRKKICLVTGFIWNAIVPIKLSFFVWRLIHNLLPLEENLQHKGFMLVSKCVCCQSGTESGLHVFLDGSVAVAIWDHFFNVFGLKILKFSCVSALLLHCEVSRGKSFNCPSYLGGGGFLKSLGTAKVFKNSSFQGDTDVIWASLAPSSTISHRHVSVSWGRPSPGSLKLNTDASVMQNVAVGDGLVRNHQGEVIFAFYKEFGDVDILATESLSLLFGLILCVQKGMFGFAVEVDLVVLVKLILSNSLAKWPLCNTMRHIRKIISQALVGISHVFREANGVVDKLASLKLGSQRIFNSSQELPSLVKAIVALDSMSFSHFRTQVVRE
ncbi:uncharacterized protein LOC113782315 [Coffea eugenioides]|uniref:uncharacterized protein LOC113782315 n=1 Tax=Coffea eugenioides TaxID=49369 RepID=UPI000F60D9F2|nr:uncharacterized protein LOC113782315 [Coffea eugenioides]